ncbi:protein ABIL2 isoform X2 [Eucalyptus grandis]|uniref:protein ABIL2 isoform X2 n=1 Tax=Eucalyptus grandis TaxID=71139 RepID=UPI00192ED06F|nr:protein ABIL2 isoform X2 [Eucalyptus grandis]
MVSWRWIMTISARGCEVESNCFIFIVTDEDTLNLGMMDASQLPFLVSAPQEALHYDELSMKESLNFSDSLKDLKDLRKQLYSAAEYFELSYNKQDQKQIVVNTLRDYATKAFISTVDHLGSMTYKVNCLLDDKIEEASAIELRFSCLQQRLQMCDVFIDHGGLSQQSLAIRTPKHHMRYILPVSQAKDGGVSKNLQYCMKNEVNSDMSADMYSRNIETSAPFVRRRHLTTQFPRSTPTSIFSFASTSSNQKAEKRTSPFLFQLTRLGSLVDRSTSSNQSSAKKRYPLEPRRSTSMSAHVERNRRTDIELYSSENNRLFKSLVSMRKSRKDSRLYKFLDEN